MQFTGDLLTNLKMVTFSHFYTIHQCVMLERELAHIADKFQQ